MQNEKTQNIVDNQEAISDKYDELGDKDCPLAYEMSDFDQKEIKDEENKSEFQEKSTGEDSLIGENKNQVQIKIDLKEENKDKNNTKNSGKSKINFAPEEKPLCPSDIQNYNKVLNSGSCPNQAGKSSNENVMIIPEEENNCDSEISLIGKKSQRENENEVQNKSSEDKEINAFDCIYFDDSFCLFNEMNNRDDDDDRLENGINFPEICCNDNRYNIGYSPHLENESDFITIDHASSWTYQQDYNFSSTYSETNN